MKPTPGPWTIKHEEAAFPLVWANGEVIAETYGIPTRCQANARLIAAAPDLLAACKEALTAFYNQDIEDAKSALKFAIQKAEATK